MDAPTLITVHPAYENDAGARAAAETMGQLTAPFEKIVGRSGAEEAVGVLPWVGSPLCIRRLDVTEQLDTVEPKGDEAVRDFTGTAAGAIFPLGDGAPEPKAVLLVHRASERRTVVVGALASLMVAGAVYLSGSDIEALKMFSILSLAGSAPTLGVSIAGILSRRGKRGRRIFAYGALPRATEAERSE